MRGITSILFGIGIYLLPAQSPTLPIDGFLACCIVDGAVAFVGGCLSSMWQSIAVGTTSLVVALLIGTLPRIDALTLVYLLAGWSMARGLLEMATGSLFHSAIQGHGLVGIVGAGSFMFATMLALAPRAAAPVVAPLFIAYALGFGALLLIMAIHLSRSARIREVAERFPADDPHR